MVSVAREHNVDFPSEAQLWVCSGKHTGKRFSLAKSESIVGSRDDADVFIDDARVSETHARLVRKGGRFYVLDLGSESGTLLNEQHVNEAELRDGDLLRVGDTVLRFTANAGDPRVVTISFESPNVHPGYEPQPVIHQPPRHLRQQHPQYPQYDATPQQMGLVPYGYQQGVHIPQHGYYQPPQQPPPQAYVVREEEELTIKELFLQLRRAFDFFWPHRRLILLVGALGAMAGVGSYFGMPPARKAMFEVALVSRAADNPVQKFEQSNVEFFRSAEQNFKSPALIEKTLTVLGNTSVSRESVASIQNRLEFTNVTPGASTYKGVFADANGEEALKFLSAHYKNYLDTEIEKTLRVISSQADFLQKRITDTEKELRRTESELLDFKKKNIDGLPEQARQHYDYLLELQRKQGEIERELNTARAGFDLDRRRLSSEDAMTTNRVVSTRPYQQTIVELNRQIAELRARGTGTEHPEMIRLRQQVEELKSLSKNAENGSDQSSVEQRRNPIYTAIQDSMRTNEAALSTAHKEKARIQKEMERIKGIVDKLPELEASHAELTRSYDGNKALHNRLFEELKKTQLQLDLERASAAARVDIITPPTLEYFSPVDRMIRRAVLVGFVGILLGMAIATFKQLKKKDEQDQDPLPLY